MTKNAQQFSNISLNGVSFDGVFSLPNQIRNGFKSSYQNMLSNSIETLSKACWIYNATTREPLLKQTSKIFSCDERGQKRHIGPERKQNKRVTTLRGGSLAEYIVGVINKVKHTRIHSLSLKGGHNERWLQHYASKHHNLSFLLCSFIPQELTAFIRQ